MKILVINCGSSSLKYQLIDMDGEIVLAKGLVERIGIKGSKLTHKPTGKEKVEIDMFIPDHKTGIKMVLDELVDKKHGVIDSMSEISAVGHRVLHGGDKYTESVLITPDVMNAVKVCAALAPLHNPASITGINACKALMPDTPMTIVFDTAFHQTMPDYAYMYALPYELYEKYAIRRYGFHGTSHRYVSHEAAKMLNRPYDKLKTITCHLGNGSSVAAVLNGKCVDTSMGLTPLEGLVMGTRCGDVDPAIIPYLVINLGISIEEVNKIIYKKSGFIGLSGISSDSRDLEAAAEKGNKRALLTLNVFYYGVKKYIGAYAAAMNGFDCLVFTAGIGENSPRAREHICENMDYLGIKIDKEKNRIRGKAVDISSADSKVKVLVIPTNEELLIARDTKEIVERL
ncbi:MAG: acetate kinase [Clostridiales bacterium]|nr:acetate kinase [Clostridiales bacterium]